MISFGFKNHKSGFNLWRRLCWTKLVSSIIQNARYILYMLSWGKPGRCQLPCKPTKILHPFSTLFPQLFKIRKKRWCWNTKSCCIINYIWMHKHLLQLTLQFISFFPLRCKFGKFGFHIVTLKQSLQNYQYNLRRNFPVWKHINQLQELQEHCTK